jgi:hypothetical protein
MTNLVERILNKSKEAFCLAIEIYNKPTIKYRVEGFSLFICNAWELMLKAHMINLLGEASIYYKDNPLRTVGLEVCIKAIFTNSKAPLRLNLEKIIELRNTSTHFITEEYEMLYVPLFQSCVNNFTEKMQSFHNIDVTELIPQNFLSLLVSMKSFNLSEIRAKYPEEIAMKLISTNNEISQLIDENNHAFAIRIEHHHYITKDINKATSIIGINNETDAQVKIIKELKDPNDTHKYSAKACMREINNRFLKIGVNWNFNSYHFDLFCKYFKIKENPRFCYIYKVYTHPTYSYSIQTIDFILDEIRKDPNIIDVLKKKTKS